MLVLTRKVGEEVIVAQDIRIKLLRIDGRCIRVGITAPPQVLITAAGTTPACERAAQRLATAALPARGASDSAARSESRAP